MTSSAGWRRWCTNVDLKWRGLYGKVTFGRRGRGSRARGRLRFEQRSCCLSKSIFVPEVDLGFRGSAQMVQRNCVLRHNWIFTAIPQRVKIVQHDRNSFGRYFFPRCNSSECGIPRDPCLQTGEQSTHSASFRSQEQFYERGRCHVYCHLQ